MAETERKGVDISQTLLAVHAAADMMLVGRKIALEALDSPPYIPNIGMFAFRVPQESGVDLSSLTEQQKVEIASKIYLFYEAMKRRAEEQRKCAVNPEEGLENILRNISTQTRTPLEIRPGDISIEWGLFSFALVAKRRAYTQIANALRIKVRDAEGITSSQLIGNLGPIPLVLSGKDSKRTIQHEDIHVLHTIMGVAYSPFNALQVMKSQWITKVLETVEPGDLEKCQAFFDGVCENALHDVEIELRSYLWEGRYPTSSLDSADFSEYTLAESILFNTIYSPVSDLSDKEKVERQFASLLKITRIDHRRKLLWAYAKQAVSEHKFLPKPWDWVASRAMVIPLCSPLPIYKAVWLGRGHELKEKIPNLEKALPLAVALITYLRKKIDPGSFGQGEMISTQKLGLFCEECLTILQDSSLYQEIYDSYGFTELDLLKARKKFIEYAVKSVPKGHRSEIKRILYSTGL